MNTRKPVVSLLAMITSMIATGHAGAQRAESVTTATAIVTPTTWTRVNVNVSGTGAEFAVLTVPSGATKPYFLRQTFTSAYQMYPYGSAPALLPYTSCDLYVNAAPAVQLMAGAQGELNVPFKAGDVISVRCDYVTGRWTFVFSN